MLILPIDNNCASIQEGQRMWQKLAVALDGGVQNAVFFLFLKKHGKWQHPNKGTSSTCNFPNVDRRAAASILNNNTLTWGHGSGTQNGFVANGDLRGW